MNKTEIALLEAIKASLFDYSPNYPDDVNWNEVVKEAKAQTVMGIVSPVIPITDEITKLVIRNYIQILYEQDKLIKLLFENNIPCVILKGSAAALYYPKPHLRAMGDVDILVPHKTITISSSLLEMNGYTYLHGREENGELIKNERNIVYEKNGIVFELHYRFSSQGYDIDDILEKAILKREYQKVDSYSIPMLPEIENGLVLLGHINQHLNTNDLGLRQILDWMMYFHKVMDSDKWHREFAPLAEKAGLKALAVYVTTMCEKYLGLPHSVDFGEMINENRIDELFDIILSNGNFGRKAMAQISNDEIKLKDSIYQIKKEGFFRHFQKLGLGTWSLCKKYPLLKPFAWIYGIVRHTVRGGKTFIKSKNLKKHINEASRRESLFNEIGVKSKR